MLSTGFHPSGGIKLRKPGIPGCFSFDFSQVHAISQFKRLPIKIGTTYKKCFFIAIASRHCISQRMRHHASGNGKTHIARHND